MRIKLHWKLTAFFCSAVIVSLALGYFYLTGHLKTFLDQDLQNDLRREVALARELVETDIQAHAGMSSPGALAHRMSTAVGMRVTLVDTKGVVLGDSEVADANIPTVENHAGRPEIRDAVKAGFGVSRRYSSTIRKDLLYMAVPFDSWGVKGVVRLAMPLADVELLEAGPEKIVGFALLLAFLFSLAFTYLIALVVSRPLEEMASVSRAIASGDFSRKPSVRSDDEVGDLARAITHMSNEIKSKITDIEQEKARLDAVIAHMFEGIMLVNDKGLVMLMNPALRKMFLLDAAPENRHAIDVIRNTALTGILERLLKGKDRFISQEVDFLLPEEKVLKVNGVVIRSSQKVEGAVLVFHDVSELRRLEKVRQDFVANVSHELRTPVASIKGYAETLLGGAMEDPAALKEFLGIIHENSDRLVNLINDLLDLARIESGRMKVVPARLDAYVVLQRSLAILEKAVTEKRLEVAVTLKEKVYRVMADEARLAQVFLNLLDNAVKYTPDGGRVTVTAVAQDRSVRFDITDTGIGIPPEDLSRIFERFYRVDKARSRDLGGTGLGLSIVKHIVHAHGGEVWVSSVVGKGTTFSFTLPSA